MTAAITDLSLQTTTAPATRVPANLSGVPETMLWTLHNRAREAMRPDAMLADPEAIRVYRSIDYDYERNFGAPDGSHALRARLFDAGVGAWLAAFPNATVVELGCGLETQFQRCDNGQVRWWAVDVPEAITLRQRLLPAERRDDRCQHLAQSALDPSWLDAVDDGRPLFVTAQGLLMYFEESEAVDLLQAILTRHPNAAVMFDVVPRWFAWLTRVGLHKTRHYAAPPMPWGLDGPDIPSWVRSWAPAPCRVTTARYGPTRGWVGALCRLGMATPGLRGLAAHAVCVSSAHFDETRSAPAACSNTSASASTVRAIGRA